jgi:4a-hydroxytetrahydrobiopterin dehydratase
MSDLAAKKCIPCSGGVPPLTQERIAELAPKVAEWRIEEKHHLIRNFDFPNFVTALAFVNRIADVAEAERHHPDIYLAWGKVQVTIWTHAIDGLTESDFILAAKINNLGCA